MTDVENKITLSLRDVSYRYPKTWGVRLRESVLSSARDVGEDSKKTRGIHKVNLRLKAGEIYGVLGPNGAGKSTLFKILSGELIPQTGEIYLKETPITHTSHWRRARLGLGYMSQRGALIDDLNVRLNLMLGAESGARWGMREDLLDSTLQSTRTPLQRYDACLEHFQVRALADQRVAELSGGERRRVELTRILLQRPSALILDEPFAALDQAGVEETIKLLKMAQAWGAMVLLTDHQRAYIKEVSDHLIYLREGQIDHPV